MTVARTRIIVAIAVIVAGAATWYVLRKPRGVVGTLTTIVADSKEAIEQWVGKQVLAVANAHLKPHLSFARLRFEFPATVHLDDVQLTSGTVQVIKADSMKIEFRETPKVGKPIVILTLELTSPVVRLIEQSQGGLVGLCDLIAGGKGEAQPDGGSTRLSDVFVIRRIGIINGTVRYEPVDQPTMYLDQLTFDLKSEPTNSPDVETAGWYDMSVHLARAPVLDWNVAGRLNIDTAAFDVRDSTLHMALQPQQYEVLPPPLQAFVREHEVTGDFTAQSSGLILLRDFAASDTQVDYRLTGGHVAFGEYQLPVESLEVKTHLRQGTYAFNPIVAKILGGDLNVKGEIKLADPHPMLFDIDAQGIRIEKALRPVSEAPPRFSGRLDSTGSVRGDIGRMDETFSGNGTLKVADARLIDMAIFGGLVRAAGGMMGAEENKDYGSTDVKLFGNRAEFTNIEVTSGAIAGRGEGTIHYNSTINFRVNAGPIERLEGALGKVGELLGKVTDKLVWYEVTGTLAEPVYTVKPLGLGLLHQDRHWSAPIEPAVVE